MNLRCGAQGDIALHVNPRFGEGRVVRNSHIGGWGTEERSGSFPFALGTQCVVVIECEQDRFKVALTLRTYDPYLQLITRN